MAWFRVSISLRTFRICSSRDVTARCAACSAGSVLRPREEVKAAVLRIGAGFAGVCTGRAVTFGVLSGDALRVMVCAKVLGWYAWTSPALWLDLSGVVSDFDVFNGDTNGLASVLDVSLSLRRFAVNGEDMFSMYLSAGWDVSGKTRWWSR
jgi:hypothetical protein